MLQARVRQLWPAGRQHRWARLVYDQVGPTSAVPLQNMRGNGQHEYGHSVQRSPLHSQGVRPSSDPANRGREHFCHGPDSRNTIARWLERASRAAERFNQQMLRDFEIVELQADEL